MYVVDAIFTALGEHTVTVIGTEARATQAIARVIPARPLGIPRLWIHSPLAAAMMAKACCGYGLDHHENGWEHATVVIVVLAPSSFHRLGRTNADPPNHGAGNLTRVTHPAGRF